MISGWFGLRWGRAPVDNPGIWRSRAPEVGRGGRPSARICERRIVRQRPGVVLLGLLLIALLARLAFAVWAVGLDGPLRGDEINYQDHAVNLASGRGFVGSDGLPAASRPPIFPLILGGLYRVFGVHLEVARIFQILLGVLVVALTYLLAGRLFTTRIGLVAAALVAINPYLVFISSYVLTENLYTVLGLTVLLVLEIGRRRAYAGIWLPALAGGLIGLASLTRPNAVGLVAFAAIAVTAFSSGGLARRSLRGAVVVAAMILALAPWTLRNHARLGEWVVLTTHGGITFYQSNNPLVCSEPAFYGSVAPREALPGWERIISSATDTASDREAWRLGKTFLRENPRAIPGLLLRKFTRFWRLQSHAPSSGVKGGWWWNKHSPLGRIASQVDVGVVYAAVVIPGFLLGLVLTFGDWRKLFMLYGMIAVHVAAALVFYGSLRARLPIEPVMAIFAAYAACWLAAHVRRAPRAGPLVPGSRD
jgi:4-amino-4-deoxy-L-arabinose transferase-like glycosyltransferase